MALRLSDEGIGEAISPLIDVVMNAFGVMFIILVMYIAVFHESGRPLLQFLETTPPPIIQGQPYLYVLPLVGGSRERTVELVNGSLDRLGLRLESSSGAVHGQAQTAGRIEQGQQIREECEFEARDTGGLVARATFTFSVAPGAVPLPDTIFRITRGDGRLPPGRVGHPYEVVLGASGGVEPYRWKVAGGPLPGGLQLDRRAGRITGVPTEPGVFAFEAVAEVTPGEFHFNDKSYTWAAGEARRRYELVILEPLSPALNLPRGRVGEPYVGALAMSSRLGDEVLEWESSVPGLHFSSSDGSVTGVPESPGEFPIRFQIASAGIVVARGDARIEVLPASPPKSAGGIAIPGWIGEQIDVPIPYRGLREPVQVSVLEVLPSGLFIEEARLRGTPTTVGVSKARIRVRDPLGATVEGELHFHVHPARHPVGLPRDIVVPLVVGSPFMWRPPSVGGDSRGIWSVEGDLPAGASIADGIMTGTVTTRGEWRSRVTVGDPVTRESVARDVVFRAITPDDSPIRLVTSSVPPALVRADYEFTFAAEGGVGAPSFSLEGELPPGMSFTSNGLKGTPIREGKWSISVVVRDGFDQRDGPREFVVEVLRADDSQPELLTQTVPPAFVGVPYDFAFSVAGGVGVPKIELSGQLPAGLEFANGRIAGTADKIEEVTIQLSGADEAGRRLASKEFRLRVLRAEQEQVRVVTSGLGVARRGAPYVHELAAEGGFGRYHWRVKGEVPPGLASDRTGLRGIVSQNARVGSWPLRISARDEAGTWSPERDVAIEVVDSP